ncbi:MAG: hypothetical protein ACOYM3_11340 [Terrimicrobiaceae bacterium]
MKRILLHKFEETVAAEVMDRLQRQDCLVILSQMIPTQSLWQTVIESQVHVAVAAQSDLETAKSNLWAFTQSLTAEHYDFSNDGVDRLVADIIAMPMQTLGGMPGHRVVGVGLNGMLSMKIPGWTGVERQKIIAGLGALRAVALMREAEIRKYHQLAARYLDRVTTHAMITRLPMGARFAALRGCLARTVGALAQFFPMCDPDSLPAAGTEIQDVIAIQPMATPQALYAVECIRRQMPDEQFPNACRHVLLSELPAGLDYPVEKQMAVLTQLCHQLLRMVSDLLLTLIDAPRAKVRQVNQARSRLTALIGICFAEASWDEIVEAGDAAGPIATYGFGQYLVEKSGEGDAEALLTAS